MRFLRMVVPACLLLWQAAAVSAGSSRPAMLTGIVGGVEVKAAGQAAWKKASLMALLNVGDTLRTGKASTATVVFFADGHREKLLAETTASVKAAALATGSRRVVLRRGSPEPSGAQCVVVFPGGVKLSAAGTAAPGRPGAYGIRGATELCLLSPVGNKIRAGNPTFAWTAVSGAQQYRLVVMAHPSGTKDEEGRVVLEKRLSETRLAYPADAEPLQPRILYSWSVEALAGEQSLGKQESSFGVLAPGSVQRLSLVETSLMKLAAGNPGDTTGPVLLGRLYVEYGLWDDAIKQFERAAALNPDDLELAKWLLGLYRSVGWDEAAERQLKRARELGLPAEPAPAQLP